MGLYVVQMRPASFACVLALYFGARLIAAHVLGRMLVVSPLVAAHSILAVDDPAHLPSARWHIPWSPVAQLRHAALPDLVLLNASDIVDFPARIRDRCCISKPVPEYSPGV